MKIDNHFPDGDTIVMDTKKYAITVSREIDGRVSVTILYKKNMLEQYMILGEEGAYR
jgi:hypothetical protein